MHALIVWLDGQVFEELESVSKGDAAGFAIRAGEEAVVVAATAAETGEMLWREGEAGHEDEVERGDFDSGAGFTRLPGSEAAAEEIGLAVDEAREEVSSLDAEEDGAVAVLAEPGEE